MTEDPILAHPLGSESEITLAELCRVFEIHADDLIELVEYGVVEPFAGQYPSQWRFSGHALVRVRRALRLRRDLAIEPAGAALALDLIEELQLLRSRLAALERGRGQPGGQ